MDKEHQSNHKMLPAEQVPIKSLCPSTQVAEDWGSVIFLMTEGEKDTGHQLPQEDEEGVLEALIGKVTRTLADRPE